MKPVSAIDAPVAWSGLELPAEGLGPLMDGGRAFAADELRGKIAVQALVENFIAHEFGLPGVSHLFQMSAKGSRIAVELGVLFMQGDNDGPSLSLQHMNRIKPLFDVMGQRRLVCGGDDEQIRRSRSTDGGGAFFHSFQLVKAPGDRIDLQIGTQGELEPFQGLHRANAGEEAVMNGND